MTLQWESPAHGEQPRSQSAPRTGKWHFFFQKSICFCEPRRALGETAIPPRLRGKGDKRPVETTEANLGLVEGGPESPSRCLHPNTSHPLARETQHHRDWLCSPLNFSVIVVIYGVFSPQKKNPKTIKTKRRVWRMNAFPSVIATAISTYGNSMRAQFWFMFDILFNWILQENCFHYWEMDLPSCKERGGGNQRLKLCLIEQWHFWNEQ